MEDPSRYTLTTALPPALGLGRLAGVRRQRAPRGRDPHAAGDLHGLLLQRDQVTDTLDHLINPEAPTWNPVPILNRTGVSSL